MNTQNNSWGSGRIERELCRLAVEKAMGRKLALGYHNAPVEPKVMELFRFGDKLNRRPGEMEKVDVDRLREAGWSDGAIFETVLVTRIYNYANRFSAGVPRQNFIRDEKRRDSQ